MWEDAGGEGVSIYFLKVHKVFKFNLTLLFYGSLHKKRKRCICISKVTIFVQKTLHISNSVPELQGYLSREGTSQTRFNFSSFLQGLLTCYRPLKVYIIFFPVEKSIKSLVSAFGIHNRFQWNMQSCVCGKKVVNPFYTDNRENDKTRHNDNLNGTNL